MAGTENHIHYTAADIEKYWKGQLSASEQHAMEKAALDDPFLADALEGYEKGHGMMMADNQALRQRLQQRVDQTKKTRVISINWKVAASVILLAGAGWLYFSHSDTTKNKEVAKASEPAIVPAPTKADSSATAVVNAADSANIVAMLDPAKKKRGLEPASKASSQQASDTDAVTSGLMDVASNNAEKDRLQGILPAAPALPKVSTIDNGRNFSNNQADLKNAGIAQRNNNYNFIVTDPQHRPIANAAVQIPALSLATKTDRFGNLSFYSNDSISGISIASSKFQTRYIQLDDSASLQQIVLQPKPNKEMPREVITKTDGAMQRKAKAIPASLEAEPVIGWDAYMDYLEKNRKVPADLVNVHGTVVLSFNVRAKNIGGFAIEDSLEDQLDQEAIRLVQNGPAWKLLTGKKTRVTLTVVF